MKAKAKSGGKSKKGAEQEIHDVGPYGFGEDGEEEEAEVDEPIEEEKVTRKRKPPVGLPEPATVPVPKKASKTPSENLERAAKQPSETTTQTPKATEPVPEVPAAASASPSAADAAAREEASLPAVVESDTQEGTLWLLGFISSQILENDGNCNIYGHTC